MRYSHNTAIKFNQRKRNLDEAMEYVENELNESELLIKEVKLKTAANSKVSSYGYFKDDTWIFLNHLSSTYIYFHFDKLKSAAFDNGVLVIKSDKDKPYLFQLIKCWVGEKILDHSLRYGNAGINKINLETFRKTFSTFVNFVCQSNFFDLSFLNKNKGDLLLDFFDSLNNDVLKSSLISALLDFFEYSSDKIPEELDFVVAEYAKEVSNINASFASFSLSRDLPSGKDFFYFSFYLKKFFNDIEVDDLLKKYYMPVLLWWEITNIIPMRPTEFCVGIKRDALIVEDGKYYLKIIRIKETPSSKKRLPLLKRIVITERIYKMITSYISITDEYGPTETLLSYPALKYFRGELTKIYTRKFQVMPNQRKVDETKFSNTTLNKLLYSFQSFIIKEYFEDNFINKFLLPGDTRHLAFTSMMLQGYSPVEIAIAGGHRTLSSLNNYISSVNAYIDIETISLSNNILTPNAARGRLIDIILSRPQTCPVSLEDCIPAVIGDSEIGYCTANHKQGYQCEDDECFNCSKWWCEPTKENFALIKNAINAQISNEESKLKRDIEFFMSLFNDSGIVFLKDFSVLSNDCKESFQYVSSKIKSTTENVVSLKRMISESEDGF